MMQNTAANPYAQSKMRMHDKMMKAFGVLWLSSTVFYLLFKSFRKSDIRWVTGTAKRPRTKREATV